MFTVEKHERAAVVKIENDLDARSAQQAKEFFTNLVTEGSTKVVVDMSALSFVDSSGLGALVTALKLARQDNGRLCLCGLTPTVNSIFQMTRLQRVFDIFPGVDEALESFSS